MRFRVRPVRRLAGSADVPGDKSVSHRAALLGAIADGATEIHGYLEAEDCLRTITAVQALGAAVTRKGPGHYRIEGAGRHGLHEPTDVIDCGNSGTAVRLLLGVLAGQPFWTMLTGDESLRRRPMARVGEPLRRMGAAVVGRSGGSKLPLAVKGTRPLRAITHDSPVASAQVKSAVLLAGLYADGPVSVSEPAPSRDHSERMLRQFGARLLTDERSVTLTPGDLRGTTVSVPGDISSAAFLLVAAALAGDPGVTIHRVGVNPTRTGVLDVLEAMGARLEREPAPSADEGEPAAALTASASELRATSIEGALIPRLIDEIPVLAVAAACAHGVTTIGDAAELRVKESDRIAALARELDKMGVVVQERPDGMSIAGPQRFRGARVTSGGDHRVAMALAVAGLVAEGETVIDDTACVGTSFPQFAATLNALAGTTAVVVED
ncbi:MAG: 3-phosphoshikimate 1-carboxyvinyltransferase [Candidatus Rokuibacteriota bacterium]|nr:MAG: 3-phosphoshikimate 1-carboxyvinyltransferase [Candidatus Rokubacteria bacterium]